MEKTLLDKFNENSKILNETFEIKKLNETEDNSFEVTNELIDELNVPKENQNTMKFIFYELTEMFMIIPNLAMPAYPED